MITQVEIASSLSGIPTLSLGTVMPNSDPVQIRSIDGLGPVKAETASTPFATGRGEMYQGINTGKRNIVLNLGLNPNWIDQTMGVLSHITGRKASEEEAARKCHEDLLAEQRITEKLSKQLQELRLKYGEADE